MSITLSAESVQIWTAVIAIAGCIFGAVWFLMSLDQYVRTRFKVMSLALIGVGIASACASVNLYQRIQTVKHDRMSPEWAALYEQTKNITASDNVAYAQLKFVSQTLRDGLFPPQTADQMELLIDLLGSGEGSRHLAPKVYEILSPYIIPVSKDGVGQIIVNK